MEIRVTAGDIIDRLDGEDIKDVFAAYLKSNVKDLFMEADGYWGNKKLTKFGEEVVGLLRHEIKQEMLADLMADESFIKELEEIKERIRKEMGKTIQEGIVKYIMEQMFMNQEYVAATVRSILDK
jgi:type I site-specific restriction-modification system R (restriction) subunit